MVTPFDVMVCVPDVAAKVGPVDVAVVIVIPDPRVKSPYINPGRLDEPVNPENDKFLTTPVVDNVIVSVPALMLMFTALDAVPPVEPCCIVRVPVLPE